MKEQNKEKMKEQWRKRLSDLQNLMLPRLCPVCSQRLMPNEQFICLACSMDLPRINLNPIDDNAMIRKLWAQIPVKTGTSVIAYRHQSPFHNILVNIKYHGATELAFEMGRWAACEITSTAIFEQIDVMVPVPLSRRKMQKRGYNQSLLLCNGMAQVNRQPIRNWLHRISDENTQTHLNEEERIENTINAFEADIPIDEHGKRILLVDDVFTTGATMTACAKAILKSDETAIINVFTLAYTV